MVLFLKMHNFLNQNKNNFKSEIFEEFVNERMRYTIIIWERIKEGNIKNVIILGSQGDSKYTD